MMIFICLHIVPAHYHYYADVSESIQFFEIAMYIRSSGCLRLSQISLLYFMQYMRLCAFILPIYLVMNVKIWVLYLLFIITKSDV